MRRYVIASHAHLAWGMRESLALLAGNVDNVYALCLFVDGNDNPEAAIAELLASFDDEDEVVVCTDLLGGSVNNAFACVIAQRPGTLLVTNTNLAFMLELLCAGEDGPLDETIRLVLSEGRCSVSYVNDLIDNVGADEDF